MDALRKMRHKTRKTRKKLLTVVVVLVTGWIFLSCIVRKPKKGPKAFIHQQLLLRNISVDYNNIFPWLPPVYQSGVLGNVFHTPLNSQELFMQQLLNLTAIAASSINEETSNVNVKNKENTNCSNYFQDAFKKKYVFPNFYGKACQNHRFRTTISLLLQLNFNNSDQRRNNNLQLTDEEIRQFKNIKLITNNWRSSISLVIYFDSNNENVYYRYEDFKQKIQDIFDVFNLHLTSLCIHAVISEEKLQHLPINTLRNVAIRFAANDVMLVSDADLIPPPKLDLLINKHIKSLHYKNKDAFVLPVFQMKSGFKDKTNNIPENKEELLLLWKRNISLPLVTGRKSIKSEDVWARYKTSSVLYKMNYTEQVLFYIVNRRVIPSYSETMQLGHKDRSFHAWLLNHLGFQFYVLPDAFLIHLPTKWSYKRNNLTLQCATIAENEIKKKLIMQ